MDGWQTLIADFLGACAVLGVGGLARLMFWMNTKIESNLEAIQAAAKRLSAVEDTQNGCMNHHHMNEERISLAEQRQEYLHEAISEMKTDVKELLRYVRRQNGGSS